MQRAELIAQLLAIYGNLCLGCGVSFLAAQPTVDHRLPTSRGGSNDRDNLWLLCAACNNDKGDLTVEEWQEWLGRSGPKCCEHGRNRHTKNAIRAAARIQWGPCWYPGCECQRYRRPGRKGFVPRLIPQTGGIEIEE